MKKRHFAPRGYASLALAAAALMATTLVPVLLAPSAQASAAAPNLEATLKAQRKLVESRPNDAVAQNDLGNLLELSGDHEAAEVAYQKAIELDSTSTAAHFNLALLYQQQKKDRKAAKVLEELLEIDPNHAWAHYQLGVVYERKGRRNSAIEHYARAFALDTGLSFARNNPQVLDSSLATESLLLAQTYVETTEDRVPRQFSDTARIRRMMLAEGAEGAAATEVGQATEAAPEEGSRPGVAATGGTGKAAAESQEAAPRVLTNDDLQSGGAGNAGSNRSNSRTRGTTPNPRSSSTFGGAPPAGVATSAPPAGFPQKGAPNVAQPAYPGGNPGTTGVYIPTPVDPSGIKQAPGQPTQPTVVTPPNPQQPFRPGRRSTASLNWQLEPTDGQGVAAG